MFAAAALGGNEPFLYGAKNPLPEGGSGDTICSLVGALEGWSGRLLRCAQAHANHPLGVIPILFLRSCVVLGVYERMRRQNWPQL